ncbi:hypothetical protein ACIQKB_04085 [Streptomyces sp. NPDC092046]|uniref:hypothetical protein n=1 Tax=Streptomyces sp. NPDC092046 TaxID=3366009 RepID=UPI00381A5514
MHRPTRPAAPASRDQALAAVAEAVEILSDLRTPERDPKLDEQIDALLQAGVVIARTPDHTA